MYYKQNLEIKNVTRGYGEKTAENLSELELNSSEYLIELSNKTCYLESIKLRLKRLFKGICNIDFKIDDTSCLNINELAEKGSITVCTYNGLFLPATVALFDNVELNAKWYLASIYINAFAHLFNGFPSVHGMKGFESSEVFLRNTGMDADFISKELFYILDIYRIVSSALNLFPGAVKIIKDILTLETMQNPSIGSASIFNMILYSLLYNENVKGIGRECEVKIDELSEVIRNSELNCKDYNDVIRIMPEIRDVFTRIFRSNETQIKSYKKILSFYSDYSYCVSQDQYFVRKSRYVYNSIQQKDKIEYTVNNRKKNGEGFASNDDNKTVNKNQVTEGEISGFVYNEWNNNTQDYLRDWCNLHEINNFFYLGNSHLLKSLVDQRQVRDVKQFFEKLKPDLMKRQKNLPIGDEIELNTLVNYYVEKRARLCPEEKIYSKNFKNERDIATALVIDVSGSTSQSVGEKEVIEIEKSAVFLLAEGLKELDDKFGIFGFSSLGRDKCFYYVFKDFNEEWNEEQKQKLAGFYPTGTTRIGTAIRHTTEKLKQIDSQKKLMIIITDGKPQDNDGYTTEGFYAQYDVRMACIEAKRSGVVIFCISTEKNSIDELELMFPIQRYVVMRSITELPHLLARSYVKLTI